MTKPHIYIARYAKKTNTVVEGVAKTGEISPKGTVAHTEDLEGRVAVLAAPATIRWVRDPDGTLRPKTMKEMIRDGQFLIGVGPN
jgi:hypothetical protein